MSEPEPPLRPAPVCRTCTIRLVELAYGRAPWLRAVREPLRLGMLALSRLEGIDVSSLAVRTERCRGCLRFHKELLKERSGLFRLLNRLLNPLFDGVIVRIVGAAAVAAAKESARNASQVDGGGPSGGRTGVTRTA